MADYRSLEIKVAQARHLKNVNLLSDMDPYVVVSLSTDPQTRLKTPVHRTGNKNPVWNFPLRFCVDVASPHLSRHTLEFVILCERALGDKPIGVVHVSLSDLLPTIKDPRPCHVAYQVRRPSGRAKGELSFSYQWGEHFAGAQPPATAPPLPEGGKAEEAVTAYPLVAGTSSGFHQAGSGYGSCGPYRPAPHGGYHYQYPPPVVGYSSHPSSTYVGYPPPQQYGGYPSPGPNYGYHQTGHVYPPMSPAPKRNTNSGLGLGVGLLGGLLIGDLLF